MTQLTLFTPTVSPASRYDVARSKGISTIEFCRQESEFNDRHYGISYFQRCELSTKDVTFPWLKLGDIPPPIERDWALVYQEYQAARNACPDVEISPKKLKLIAQWSIDAKRRNRLKRLHDRLHRQYSIPDLFHTALMKEVLRNPNYYGICVLPCESQCVYIPIINPRQQAAIDRENQFRRDTSTI